VILIHVPGGTKPLKFEAKTVRELLHLVTESAPELKTKVFSGSGALRRTAGVFVNEERVQLEDALPTTAVVNIVLAISGG
jgi:hypothetical protein